MVPAEYIGKARQLRRDMAAAATASRLAVDGILAPLREQLSRRPTMRDETIAGAMRAWKLSAPPLNRVSLSIQMKRGTAHIDEGFIASSELQRPGWGLHQWEPGLCLTWATIRLSRGDVQIAERDLCALSLHAIGRRFERGTSPADRSHAAVLHDLAGLCEHHPDTMSAGGFTIAAGSGCWVGEMVLIEGKPIALIRSFLHAGMIP